MSLKSKAGLIFLGIFILYGVTDYALQKFVILPGFLALEYAEAEKDLKRAIGAIQAEIHHLNTFCWDWSAWDDTYEFIAAPSRKYIESNLTITTFTDNHLNLVYFLSQNGTVIWGEIRDLKSKQRISLSDFGTDALKDRHALFPWEKCGGALSDVSISGLLPTEKGPMLIASRPILNSENEGPARGTLIMGRFLDDPLIKKLVNQSKVLFRIQTVAPGSIPGFMKKDSAGRPQEYLIEPQGKDKLRVLSGFPGVTGNSDFLISAVVPRVIYLKGTETTRYALLTGLVSVLVMLGMMLFVLQRTILRPIVKLKNHALAIGKTGDLSARLKMRRRDEIGALAGEFDTMLEKLDDRTEKLALLNEDMRRDMARRIKVEAALRESEEKRFRSKKMESLGLMAGGIAHDLNNILSGIVSYPELLLMNLPEDSHLRKPLNTIRESGMRAADVVADLLTVARGVAADKVVMNLNKVVEEHLDSPEHQTMAALHPSVNLKTDLDASLFNIQCSPIHIKKSLMNLVSNAFEAIPDSGTVTVSTANRYLNEPVSGYTEVRVGEYVLLSVSDDGPGISSGDMERIFEPFYTKKVMGRSGTGLGLAVVWNTIQEHDGYINVLSTEKGTLFELFLPVSTDQQMAGQQEISLTEYLGQGEKILVVDDEETQREIGCQILLQLGYDVDSVASGEEAVQYAKEHGVDIMVLDMLMPEGINGRETYERVLAVCPGQRAIIASGFSETEDVKIAQRLGAGRYLKKPYTMETLGLAVREELDK